MPRTTLAVVATAVALLVPASALAAPPPNDNYLASVTINTPAGSLPPEFADNVDTTEATTQPDTFNPNRDGLPFGGGKPEPTSCPGGPSFGKTVWYDFLPPVPGGVQINAAGVDAAVAVYRWDPETSQLGATVVCQNASSGPTEEVLLQEEIRRDRNYTIQVGGVNGAGGPLDFRFTFFPDTDGDGIIDEQPDRCRRLRGIAAFGGCPPVVRGGPRILFDRLSGGIRVTSLFLDRVAKGARVEVRCRRCGSPVRTRARRAGSLEVRGFRGRTVGAGDRIEIRLTQPRSRSGRYRFGAIGKVFRWPVVRGGLGPRTERCTRPDSRKRITCP
jgi:hypothetical protein